jgi:hypothetical protein
MILHLIRCRFITCRTKIFTYRTWSKKCFLEVRRNSGKTLPFSKLIEVSLCSGVKWSRRGSNSATPFSTGRLRGANTGKFTSHLLSSFTYWAFYCFNFGLCKVVQIWPGQTVTCLHTNRPGHIWTTLYFRSVCDNSTQQGGEKRR